MAEDVIGNGDVAGGRIEFDGVRNGDDVLFDRAKEEEFLVLDGSAESAAHLMLGVTAAVVAEGVWRSDGAVAIGIEAFAVVVVRAGLSNSVDIAGIGAADFGGGAVAHDLEFTDGQLREEVRDSLGPPPRWPPWRESLKSMPSTEMLELMERWPLMTMPERLASCMTLGVS